jgi:hypothetical protein
MGMVLVHDESVGSAASEAALWEDGIEAMLERRDALLECAAVLGTVGVEGEHRRVLEDEARHIGAEAGIQRFRLLAFRLANGVEA